MTRPLLGMFKWELEAYCQAQGLSYVSDPTNDDLRHPRNHVRWLLRQEALREQGLGGDALQPEAELEAAAAAAAAPAPEAGEAADAREEAAEGAADSWGSELNVVWQDDAQAAQGGAEVAVPPVSGVGEAPPRHELLAESQLARDVLRLQRRCEAAFELQRTMAWDLLCNGVLVTSVPTLPSCLAAQRRRARPAPHDQPWWFIDWLERAEEIGLGLGDIPHAIVRVSWLSKRVPEVASIAAVAQLLQKVSGSAYPPGLSDCLKLTKRMATGSMQKGFSGEARRPAACWAHCERPAWAARCAPSHPPTTSHVCCCCRRRLPCAPSLAQQGAPCADCVAARPGSR